MEILSRLEGVKGGGGQYSARCPNHGDRHNSLSVSIGNDGRVLLNCHAGCNPEDIVGSMGLTMKDLFAEVTPGEAFPTYNTPRKQSGARFEAEYIYHDAKGKPLLKKVKMREADGGKFCFWQRPEGDRWVKGRGSIEPPLYTSTGGGALPGGVFLVEGEKDVDTIRAIGKAAASLPDGAKSKWHTRYGEALKGRTVVIIPDNDTPGQELAQRVAGELHKVASSVKVIDLTQIWPELPDHGDTTDLIEHMGPEAGMSGILTLAKDSPEWELPATKKQEHPRRLKVISAPELQKAKLPPIRFLVEGMLPEGTSMVTAASKVGKSWMVLHMGLCIATGTSFMGHKANQCGVLYLALEDSLGRLQDRMNKILDGRSAPSLFYFTTEAPTLDDGLLDILDGHVKQHPDTRLIIIDTLQKIRGQALPRESSYAQDYREMGAIKSHMDKGGISVFFVHHNRKMKDDDDPFNMISGTNGIMGAADTIWVITKDKRTDDSATLHITGRDVPQSDTVVRFNKDTWRWDAVGDAGWLAEQQARQEYDESPVVKTIKRLLEQSPERRWDGTAKDLMEAGKYIARTYIAPTAAKLGYAIKALDKPLFDYDGIIHSATANGNAGKRHSFYYQDLGEWVNVEQEELPFPNM